MSIEEKSAPVRSLYEYLTCEVLVERGVSKSRVLVIPPWQRDYVWTPSDNGEVGELLDDLKKFVTSDDSDYLMGAILLSKSANGSKERLLIDGQQRTLTFTLLLMSLHKYITENRNKIQNLPGNNVAHEEETMTELRKCLSNDTYEYDARVSMPHSNADIMLQKLFQWSKVRSGDDDYYVEERENWTQTQRNLTEVAQWIFEKKLANEGWLPDQDLLRHLKKILGGVKFLEITLSNQREAIAVFDRINSRGAQLNSGDLIKNRIFQSVQNDTHFEAISDSWMKMSASLAKGNIKRAHEAKYLLRALALSDQEIRTTTDRETGEELLSAQKITYESLTEYWGDRLEGISQTTPLDPIKFASRLEESASQLQKLTNEQSPNGVKLPELYFSRFMGSVQHYPVLLAGVQNLDGKLLEELTKQVHMRTAYYILSDERTQTFESMIPLWTGLIAKLSAKSNKSDLEEIYHSHIAVPDEDLDILVQQMHLWNYTKASDRKKIRATLSQLTRLVDKQANVEPKDNSPECYFNTKGGSNSETWDIEHVRPKFREPKDSIVHNIGNLVLLKSPDNSHKKTSTPGEKADVYRGSHRRLTQSLVEITVGRERSRIEQLFEKAGASDTSWNIGQWTDDDISLRAKLYGALLKYHLRNFI